MENMELFRSTGKPYIYDVDPIRGWKKNMISEYLGRCSSMSRDGLVPAPAVRRRRPVTPSPHVVNSRFRTCTDSNRPRRRRGRTRRRPRRNTTSWTTSSTRRRWPSCRPRTRDRCWRSRGRRPCRWPGSSRRRSASRPPRRGRWACSPAGGTRTSSSEPAAAGRAVDTIAWPYRPTPCRRRRRFDPSWSGTGISAASSWATRGHRRPTAAGSPRSGVCKGSRARSARRLRRSSPCCRRRAPRPRAAHVITSLRPNVISSIATIVYYL